MDIPTYFFSHSMTVEQVKSVYKQWAMKLHPDLHQDGKEFYTDCMKELNKQYESALRNCDGQESVGSDGKSHTYKYDYAFEKEITQVIETLIANLSDRILNNEIDVYLIGIYVWIGRTSKEMTDVRKVLGKVDDGGLGFRWNSTRMMWYWKPEGVRSYKSSKGLAHIAAQYGYTNIKDEVKKPSGKSRAKAIA